MLQYCGIVALLQGSILHGPHETPDAWGKALKIVTVATASICQSTLLSNRQEYRGNRSKKPMRQADPTTTSRTVMLLDGQQDHLQAM